MGKCRSFSKKVCCARCILVILSLCAFLSCEEKTLHEALGDGDVSAAKTLIRQGVDVDARDDYGATALHDAALEGRFDFVDLLLDAGADANAKESLEQCTPLHYAAMRGNAKIVRLLIDGGSIVDARDRFDNTPLHKAAFAGHVSIAILLLEKGASVDAINQLGNTPLHESVRYGQLEIAKVLLSRGASLEAMNQKGKTADQMDKVEWIDGSRHSAVVKYLRSVERND